MATSMEKHYRSSRLPMFFKVGVLKNFELELLSNKVTGLKPYNFIKKRLQYRRFHVNTSKFLRTAFFNGTLPVAASNTIATQNKIH